MNQKYIRHHSIAFFITTISLVFLHTSCNDKPRDNSLKRLNLKGKVESLKEIPYEAIERFGIIEKGKISRNHSQFEHYKILFNNKGNVKIRYTYDSEGKTIEKYTSIYDDNDWLIESQKHTNRYTTFGNLDYKWIYKYDEKGNQIESSKFNYDGQLDMMEKHKNDSNGNAFQTDNYNSDGRLVLQWQSEYDEKGNMVLRKGYDSEGRLFWTLTSKYNRRGNLVEMTSVLLDARLKGSLDKKETFKYDEFGNKIEHNTYSIDGRLISKESYIYDFDEIGNWIRQIIYKDNTPICVVERTIKYFD